MASLRAQLLLGAVLWTVGLFITSMATLAVVWAHVPDLPVLGRSGSIHQWVRHTGPLLAVAVACMVAGVFQVRRGLAGITQLRARLAAVHDRRGGRVEGRYVAEVQPLVDDLNALLDHRERAVRRAVAKAGDLAHGLKTPLAVLAREAERAAAAGQHDLAAAIGHQLDRMRRQIDYHLAHARAAASGAAPGAGCAVWESADGLARTMRRLYADSGPSIDVRVPASHAVRVQREDLDEMLGNLLDNACKWARSRVVIESREDDRHAVITVDDDGPGLAPALRDPMLERGARADEKVSGSGLGLAIVRDLAEVYGGTVALQDSALGGLRAALTLPVRPAPSPDRVDRL
jgi:signal transduction histidine kinase